MRSERRKEASAPQARELCCVIVALARSYLRAGGFSEHFVLGVLAGGSESHVSPTCSDFVQSPHSRAGQESQDAQNVTFFV